MKLTTAVGGGGGGPDGCNQDTSPLWASRGCGFDLNSKQQRRLSSKENPHHHPIITIPKKRLVPTERCPRFPADPEVLLTPQPPCPFGLAELGKPLAWKALLGKDIILHFCRCPEGAVPHQTEARLPAHNPLAFLSSTLPAYWILSNPKLPQTSCIKQDFTGSLRACGTAQETLRTGFQALEKGGLRHSDLIKPWPAEA